MRELRFVTRAEDGAILVEEPNGFERFRLPVDDTLRAALAGPTPASPPPVTVSRAATPDPISPREIQIRVRAGESPQLLADEHGMPLDRVMRFAGPVLDERSRITDEARRARARRTGYDDSEARIVLFGEAVDERFAAYGVDLATVTWDARRREDGEWLVTAAWPGSPGSANPGSANPGSANPGGRTTDDGFGAQWLFNRGSRSVTPLDDSAVDLLSDRPIRPVTPPAPHITAPPLAPGVIAFPPFPDAHTGPIKRIDEVFDQEDTRDLPRRASVVPDLVPTASLDFEEPPLPLAITDGEGRPAAATPAPLRAVNPSRRGAESDDEKAARARIPSWDDILLGVRRKDD